MSKLKQSSDPILPGESVASIEEFEGGKNTYIDNGLIRSAQWAIKFWISKDAQ